MITVANLIAVSIHVSSKLMDWWILITLDFLEASLPFWKMLLSHGSCLELFKSTSDFKSLSGWCWCDWTRSWSLTPVRFWCFFSGTCLVEGLGWCLSSSNALSHAFWKQLIHWPFWEMWRTHGVNQGSLLRLLSLAVHPLLWHSRCQFLMGFLRRGYGEPVSILGVSFS